MSLVDQPNCRISHDRYTFGSTKAHLEVVSDRLSWRYAALSRSNWAIHMSRTVHVQAMKMQAGGLVPELVQNVDNNLIANSRRDVRYRPFAVYANDWTWKRTIRIRGHPGDIEVVCDCRSPYGRAEQKGQKIKKGIHDHAARSQLKHGLYGLNCWVTLDFEELRKRSLGWDKSVMPPILPTSQGVRWRWIVLSQDLIRC